MQMSKDDAEATAFLETKKDVWSSTVPLKEIVGKESGFDALFFVGGHGRGYPPGLVVASGDSG